jgi:hypothetical protein
MIDDDDDDDLRRFDNVLQLQLAITVECIEYIGSRIDC